MCVNVAKHGDEPALQRGLFGEGPVDDLAAAGVIDGAHGVVRSARWNKECRKAEQGKHNFCKLRDRTAFHVTLRNQT